MAIRSTPSRNRRAGVCDEQVAGRFLDDTVSAGSRGDGIGWPISGAPLGYERIGMSWPVAVSF